MRLAYSVVRYKKNVSKDFWCGNVEEGETRRGEET